MEEVYEQSIFDEEEIPVVYASFWERFGALFLDWLIMLFFSFIDGFSHNSYWLSTAVAALVSLVTVIYKPLTEYLYGATLGKKALSIIVINKAHKKPTLLQVILRNIFGIVIKLTSLMFSFFMLTNTWFNQDGSITGLGIFQGLPGYSSFLSLIIVALYIADVIVLLADKDNRSLHDFIGGTYVIKK